MLFLAFFFLTMFTVLPTGLSAQTFSRVIQLQNRRMNGPDVTHLQRRLLALGFSKTGPADGWYGPLTEGSVRTLQYFLGFPQDGRVTRAFWNVLFDSGKDSLFRNISTIANFPETFTVTSKREGTNTSFQEFVIGSQNNNVRTVLFRQVNEGLITFRFRLWYLSDAVFIMQDVYYGEYRRYMYIVTAQGLFELKNGMLSPADPAIEGILNRVNAGISSLELPPSGVIPPSGAVPSSEAVPPSEAVPSSEAVPPSGAVPAN